MQNNEVRPQNVNITLLYTHVLTNLSPVCTKQQQKNDRIETTTKMAVQGKPKSEFKLAKNKMAQRGVAPTANEMKCDIR